MNDSTYAPAGVDTRAIANDLAEHLTTVPVLTEMDRLATIVARMDEAQAHDDSGREVARILAFINDRFGVPAARTQRGRS